ncbi:MFS transporter [Tenggerimyces flavus]|uniref:MFS transporter n=1 Tax=Tenggerimyces flavus TaxID=1708749 RepID=A0ABV7YHF2_9ACTN|nr:MFS transporter [Tenggerimyces flavus]MBM7784078.1 MFS family permease [Tenggerimyces flavus]
MAGAHPAVAALRVPAFRRYLAGQLPSVTCSWAQVVGLSWVVVQLDPSALGWVVALQYAPSLVLGPWFGALVDRYDRRRLLMLAEAGLGLVATAYAVLAYAGGLTLPWVFVLAAVWGVINALDTPARRALVPMLLPPELVSIASALTGTLMLLGMSVGSALGAALVAAVGPTVAFAVNAVSFGVDVVVLWTIRVGPSPRVARAPGQIREGLRYVWQAPALRTAMLAIAVVATLGFTLQVSVPIFVEGPLRGGPGLVGIAFTTSATASLFGAITAAALGGPGPKAILRASLGMAAALAVVAAAPTFPVALVGLAGVGFAWSILITAVIAVLQSAEPSMTGRVMATFSGVLIGGMAAGGPITSVISTYADPRASFALGAVACVVVARLSLASRRSRVAAR